ncbi:MAG: hypothetical protein QOE60_167 [Thermoleophilaceae bacterium]|nr:hypothetical protein [Thermoleophilaceae bacterium]
MVDWSLARQVARLAAGSGDEGPPQADVAALCVEMEQHVADYTGLSLETPVPAAELVGRGEWASVNLDSLAQLLDPVAARLEQRLEFAGPLAGALKAGAAATLAAEAGLVLGYVAQRVLGQYEVSLLGGDAPPRLLFVAPNLRKAVRELEVEPESFHRWIAAHELTHVYQFQGVGWLREHLGGMVRSYLSTVEVRIDRGAAGGLPSMPDLSRLVENFRDGGLAALVQTNEQRAVMGQMQAAMAVVEGYSEHVMDAIGATAIPGHEELRRAMDARRRSRSAPERLIEGLLGLNMKMRQYEQGKVFCDAVAAEAGMEALNRVWDAPSSLPTPSELERPLEWLARVGPAPAAAA